MTDDRPHSKEAEPAVEALPSPARGIALVGGTSAAMLFLIALSVSECLHSCARPKPVEAAVEKPPAAPRLMVREKPERFPPNTYRPRQREGSVSGSIDMSLFSAGRDLVHVDDDRVWWESDHDKGDTECDHSMHRAMEPPLRRLIELVNNEGATLEVHDAYRPAGVHNARSLHREGRALDLTCDQLGLERLACLAWAAGFDWVYHEAGAKGGAHVHVSMRRDTEELAPEQRSASYQPSAPTPDA
jgi:hypothetical protein